MSRIKEFAYEIVGVVRARYEPDKKGTVISETAMQVAIDRICARYIEMLCK